MEQEAAKKLVRDTFEQPFSKGQFTVFIKNLLNLLEPAPFAKPLSGQDIFPEFRRYIGSYDRVGKYEDSEGNRLDVLIVNLNAEKSLERARAAQRNFVAKYLKESQQGQIKDAALVAFVSPGEQDWRFSFVRMAYKIDSSRTKVVEELSPARRYSFLVGLNENSHTAQSRFLPILANGEPKLSSLENAFAVDPVTKEFFNEYRGLYESLVKTLKGNRGFLAVAEKNNIDISNFSKKLLGQIVFLYFLQKKGWLGVLKGKTWGEGDRFFMRTLFSRCAEGKENFFNDYLEVLFYDTLNNPRSRQADRNFSQHFQAKIPFLNGGLFEPDYDWEHTTINLDNSIFESILGVFDRYNFTVKEDEPLEREVAVDPEMLGKVFENLLEENLRKGKGTYYTPREIVHYMCQESLIHYLGHRSGIALESIRSFVRNPSVISEELSKEILDNREPIDRLLCDIRVVDPACGSGAFLVGMLQEIVRARQSLRPRLTDYRMKKTAIQDCIYGVDIDPGAVDIAKLRLWLSLVVDYDLEDIEPLPNLDYKVMQGNSLLEEFEGVQFYDDGDNGHNTTLFNDDEHDKKKELLRNRKHDYFSTSDDKSKIALRNEINELIDWFVRRAVNEELRRVRSMRKAKEEEGRLLSKKDRDKHWQLWADKFAKEEALSGLLKTIHDPKCARPFFLWKLNFMEVFDQRSGFDIVIANPPYGADIDQYTQEYAAKYPTTAKEYKDIYKFFIELGLTRLANETGILSYIIPNTLLLQPRYKDARRFLLEHSLIQIINLGENVFEEGVVPTCIIVATPRLNAVKQMDYADLSSKSKFIGDMTNLTFDNIDQKAFANTAGNIFVGTVRALGKNEVTLDHILEMKDCGIKYQRTNIGLAKKGGSDLADRIFYSGKRQSKFDHEFLIGKDLDRNGWYVNETPARFLRHNFKELLKENEIVYFNQAFFESGEKLVWRQTSPYFVGALLEKPVWFANTLQGGIMKRDFVKALSPKYLLALLNSRYLRYVYNSAVRETGRVFPQVKLTKLRDLPIKVIPRSAQKPYEDLADHTIDAISSSVLSVDAKMSRVQKLQAQLDQMVFDLYEIDTAEALRITTFLQPKQKSHA